MWHKFSFHCFIILLKEVYTMTASETFMTLGMFVLGLVAAMMVQYLYWA